MEDHETWFEKATKGFAFLPIVIAIVLIFILLIAIARYWAS